MRGVDTGGSEPVNAGRRRGGGAQGAHVRRRRRRAPLRAAVLLLVALGAAGRAGALPAGLDLVDDRGRPITERIEVCFELARSLDCRRVAGGHLDGVPTGFRELRIEGDDHGPVRLRQYEIAARTDGSISVVVPRKALIIVSRGAPDSGSPGPSARPPLAAAHGEAPLTVSLYSQRDATFREPVYRRQLAPQERQLKIPAGDFIVSLSEGAHAPDLQRLAVAPAGRVQLIDHVRPGWSVVVRCLAARADGTGPAARGAVEPLAGAGVRISAAPGFGRAETVIGDALSGADGLALISGIAAPLASLRAVHAGFLPATAHGLVAAAGTFTVQEVTLVRGGRLRATVSLHGHAAGGITCRVAEAKDSTKVRGADRDRELWSGNGDAQGVCLSTPLPQGLYQLAVEMPSSSGSVHRWVSIEPDRITDEDVALAPCHVSGQVRRGGAPLAGYTVSAQESPAGLPMGAAPGRADRAATGDDGRYALTLWTPGHYALLVKTPGGAPVSTIKFVDAQGDDDQQADFDVNAGALAGRVVDQQGRGVGEASVFVTFQEVGTRVVTDDQGGFQADLQGAGTAEISAMKKGYLRGGPVAVAISEEQPAQATLVLRRDATARGRLVSAAGEPVGGAMIASLQADAVGTPNLYDTARSEADGSFVVRVPPGVPRMFVSGPDCPLSLVDLPPAARSDAQGDGGDGGAVDVAEVGADGGAAGGVDGADGTTNDGSVGGAGSAAGAGAAGGMGNADAPPAEVRCPALPASLALSIVDRQGRPVVHDALILRQAGSIVPRAVLALHLTLLGLPTATDGSGNIVLADLAPGDYDLFLSSGSSEETIAAGLANGFLMSLSLAPMASTELRATVPEAAR